MTSMLSKVTRVYREKTDCLSTNKRKSMVPSEEVNIPKAGAPQGLPMTWALLGQWGILLETTNGDLF